MATKKEKPIKEVMDQFLQCRVSPSFKERFESVASKERRTPGDLMRLIIEDYLAKK